MLCGRIKNMNFGQKYAFYNGRQKLFQKLVQSIKIMGKNAKERNK